MKCFECQGELVATLGTVRMTTPEGNLILFKNVPLNSCRQCGEQYLSGHWAEKIGEMMRQRETLVPQETLTVPVVTLG